MLEPHDQGIGSRKLLQPWLHLRRNLAVLKNPSLARNPDGEWCVRALLQLADFLDGGLALGIAAEPVNRVGRMDKDLAVADAREQLMQAHLHFTLSQHFHGSRAHGAPFRSEEHTSELQSQFHLV